MGNFTRHQKLKGVNRAGIVGVVDETFVDDLGAGFCGYVAAQINVEFASNLEVIRSPCITLRVVEVDASSPCNRHQRIGFSCFPIRFEILEMHPNERTDNLEMA